MTPASPINGFLSKIVSFVVRQPDSRGSPAKLRESYCDAVYLNTDDLACLKMKPMAKRQKFDTAPAEERVDDARSGIQVIRRAVTVLRLLAEQGQNGLSLGGIAARVGLARSTVQRIVSALEEEGMITPALAGGGFCLGPTVGILARGLDTDPVEVFRSEMIQLHEALDESVVLNTVADGRVLILETLSSTKPLRVVLPKILEVDLLTSAPGKAVLSILPNNEREASIAAAGTPFVRYQLESELNEARRAGYAIEQDLYEGISGMAIALQLNRKPYAITVLLPSGRLPAERAAIAEALLATAEALRRRLLGARL
jgi:IclR family transcriptional regulator, acetate operon repressor